MEMECYIMCNVEIKIHEFFSEASLLNEQGENYQLELEMLALQKIHEMNINLSVYNSFRFRKLLPTKNTLIYLFLIRMNTDISKKILINCY